MAGVDAPRPVTARQAATECYWQARAALQAAIPGTAAQDAADQGTVEQRGTGRTATDARFRARRDLVLVTLGARRRGWTRLAGAAHRVLLQDRGTVRPAGQGGAA
jgi:uncharacterized protein YfaQ (DUF2300 family)